MKRSVFHRCILCGFVLFCVACETPESQLVGEAPDDEVQGTSRPGGPRRLDLGRDKGPKKKQHPEPVFGASVWPYVEEGTTFELAWGAQKAEVDVFEEPDLNSEVVAGLALAKGDSIPWRTSWVAVYEPAVYRARERVEFSGTRYAPQTRTHGEPLTVTAHPGQPVAVYHYAGAATCWVGVDQDLLRTSCPSPAKFDGDFSGRTRAEQMHPRKRVWWVYVETRSATGWIAIDDRVLVDIVDA